MRMTAASQFIFFVTAKVNHIDQGIANVLIATNAKIPNIRFFSCEIALPHHKAYKQSGKYGLVDSIIYKNRKDFQDRQ